MSSRVCKTCDRPIALTEGGWLRIKFQFANSRAESVRRDFHICAACIDSSRNGEIPPGVWTKLQLILKTMFNDA